MESPDGTLSRMPRKDSKKAGYSELLFVCVGTHNSQSLPPSDLQSHENSNTAALSWGLVSIPTPAWCLTPWATPEKERVQHRCLVPEPVLCV